jgi:hypothetical protein
LILTLCVQEGEPVEYEVQEDTQGRLAAMRVTGPMGAYVQGAPKRTFNDYNDGMSRRRDYQSFGDDYGDNNKRY